jgi:hypothetical protein
LEISDIATSGSGLPKRHYGTSFQFKSSKMTVWWT